MRYKIWGGILVSMILWGGLSASAEEVIRKTEQEVQVSNSATPAPSASPAVVPAGANEIKPGDMPPGQPKPGEMSGPDGPDKKKPDEPGKKPGDKPGEAKPDESKPIPHPTEPPSPPKPEELKVKPVNGKVAFSFNNQRWAGVLQWLADISDMNFDWQEMPPDYVNLSTQNEYTVAEVRDLLNQLLLARGYTLLSRGRTLSVVNVKKLDISLVPRVEPEDLKSHQPYEFVKVSFPLETMTADAAAEEFKQMKSPNGQLIPLKVTNRLEAVDAVVNLREIHALLKSEQSPSVKQRSIKEYVLRFARAEEVHEQLATLLGKDKGAATPSASGGQGGQGMSPEMMQQIQQQQEMMARHGGGPQGGGQPGEQAKPAAAAQQGTFFAVNPRRNSILAYAPPDRIQLIDQIIETLDVPVGAQNSLAANIGRTQVYRLAGVEPETFVKTLRDMGNLDPTTDLQIDKKNRAIIVFGPLADHLVIGELVKKLSGSERRFEVRSLRRLAAEYVSGTVEFMINGDKKDKQRSSYSFWDRYNSSGEQKETTNAFRVDADTENNRLILWANDIELSDVDNLLRKLGEPLPGEGAGMTRRIITTADGQEAKALLERIEREWNRLAPNPLIKPDEAKKENKPEDTNEPSAKTTVSPMTTARQNTRPSDFSEIQSPLVKFARLGGESALANNEEPKPAKKYPPVKVELTPDGRIAVASDDPLALDLFEELADELGTPRKDYEIFHLNSCAAVDVAITLDEFFRSEDKKTTPNVPYWMRWEYETMDKPDDKAGRLSKKRPLKFIADSESNSILVRGADSKQLATIKHLIELYEEPLPENAQLKRKSDLIPLEYSKAEVLVETVKEVYRDLLSANDKAFGQNNRDQGRSMYFGWDSDNDQSKKPEKSLKFKGKLSISADKVSNTIVLSAPASLFEEVKQMILALDRAAAPASQMRVLKLGPGMRGPEIRRQLLEALGQEVPEDIADKKDTTDENKSPKLKPKKNGSAAKSQKN